MTVPLPLSEVATVTYTITPLTQSITAFNEGLIVGTSSVISTATRVVEYASLAAMVTAGFSTGSPEYLAAQMYFQAGSLGAPPTKVAIGRQGTGETCVQAVTACRAANQNWYWVFVPAAVTADHTAIAAYIQTLTSPYSMYMMQSNSAGVLANSTGNIFATLNASSETRTHGMYSATLYSVAGLMGFAAGNTNVSGNSAYTLFGKTITGSTPDALTISQVINVTTNNGNVYGNVGGFPCYLPGINFGGQYFDNIANLDLFATKVQQDIVGFLTNILKDPQTEQGMSALKNIITGDANLFVNQGTFAPGTWNGPTFGPVTTGQFLTAGFVIWSDPIATQTQSQRTSRVAPNIYMAAKSAGAIQDVIFMIDVNP